MNKATLLVAAASLLCCNSSTPLLQKADQAVEQTVNTHKAGDAEVVQAIHDAYTTVYPLVLMEMVRRSCIGERQQDGSASGRLNRFVHTCIYPQLHREGAEKPDMDMFYSSAITELTREPVVLHVPDEMGRYYQLLLVDEWGHVFNTAVSSGTASFFITGPGWQGAVPAGMNHIPAPTAGVWIAGRTQVNDKTDGEIVKSLLNRYTLTPVSNQESEAEGRIITAASGGTPPEKMLLNMRVEDMLQLANRLMQKTPPYWDAATRNRMAAIQVGPGKECKLSAWGAEVRSRLTGIPAQVLEEMRAADSGKNGWTTMKPTLLQLVTACKLKTDTRG